MARPKVELPPAEQVRSLIDSDGRIAVRVTPGARTESLELGPDRLIAKVRAKPEDGKANKAVVELVAQALAVPVSRIELLRGATTREKLLLIRS